MPARGVELAEGEAVTEITLSPAARSPGWRPTVAGACPPGWSSTRRARGPGRSRELAGADRRRVAVAPVRHQLLITEPSAERGSGQPIVRVVDAAVYLRPARGGLMVGGFEADPVPVDLREQSA